MFLADVLNEALGSYLPKPPDLPVFAIFFILLSLALAFAS